MKRELFTELMEGLNAYADFRHGRAALKITEVAMPAPPALSPAEIRRNREGLALSPAVFARQLHISLRTYQSWEQGKTKPNPQAVLLLKILAQSPQTLAHLASL